MNYLFKIKNNFFSIFLSLSLLINVSLFAEETTVTTEKVEDPFGEILPSSPEPDTKQITNNINATIDELESLEAVPDASAIEAYKLLSYVFTGVIIRSKTNRKAIVLAPNNDQYILAIGDFFSSEDAVVKDIQSTQIIVIDKNGEEYFFTIGRKGKKKLELEEISKDNDKDTEEKKSSGTLEVTSSQSQNLEVLNLKQENQILLATVQKLTKQIEAFNVIVKDQRTLIEKQKEEISSQKLIITELKEIKNILDRKFLDLENDNIQLSQIIEDSQLNKKDVDLIDQYKLENILLGQQLTTTKGENKNLSTKLISNTALLDSLETKKLALENSLSTVGSENEKLKKEINSLSEKIEAHEATKLISNTALLDSLETEKLALENLLSTVGSENEKLKKEINSLSEKIEAHEATLAILGENNIIQRTKNLLGFGENQEKIIEEIQKSNKSLSEKNILLTAELNKASALNLKLDNESSALLNKVESMQDYYDEHQSLKKEFNSVLKNRNLLENELSKLKINYNRAQETIISNKELEDSLKNKVLQLEQTITQQSDSNISNTMITTSSIVKSNSYTALSKGDRLLANTHVNMREGASTSAQVKQIIKRGEFLTFDSMSNGWAKVFTVTQESGYIDSKYLDLIDETIQEIKQKDNQTTLSVDVLIQFAKLSKSINVYKESSSKSQIVARIPAGNRIHLLSKTTNSDGETMIYTNFGGKILGYINEIDL